MTKNRWTEEARVEHSNKLKGHPGSTKLKGIPKTEEHNRKNSEALKGIKKTKEHIENLKLALQFSRVCRIIDKKEMSKSHFTRWLNSLIIEDTPLV